MMGSAIHLHVNACGQDTIIIVQTMDLSGEKQKMTTSGSSIDFTFSGNVAHIFERESGKNLEF